MSHAPRIISKPMSTLPKRVFALVIPLGLTMFVRYMPPAQANKIAERKTAIKIPVFKTFCAT